jgi:hypothetical protein
MIVLALRVLANVVCSSVLWAYFVQCRAQLIFQVIVVKGMYIYKYVYVYVYNVCVGV